MVHRKALPSQQDMQAAVTEPAALMRQGPQPLPQFRIVRPARPIPHRHAHTANGPARPPLAHVERGTQVSDSLSLGSGRHHFSQQTFSAALSHRIGQKLL